MYGAAGAFAECAPLLAAEPHARLRLESFIIAFRLAPRGAAQQQHRQGCEQHQQQDDDGSDHLFLATRIMHFQRKGSRPTPENFTTSKPF